MVVVPTPTPPVPAPAPETAATGRAARGARQRDLREPFERIAGMPCLRALQRMGEDIGDDEMALFAELEARMERDFAQLAPSPAQTAPSSVEAVAQELPDAAHG